MPALKFWDGSAWQVLAAQGPPGPVGGNATVPIEAWKTIGADGGLSTFTAPFVNYGSTFPAQYRKRPDGIVELQGFVKVSSGTASSGVMFTLPSGYRPSLESYMPISAHSGSAYIEADLIAFSTSGNVNLARASALVTTSGWISLNGIRFPTGQTDFPTGPQGPVGPAYSPPLITTPAALAALSPVDGQEVYFQNTNMATLNVMWRLRYRAGKWDFVGGPPLSDYKAPYVTTTSPGYVILDGGPQVTVPLQGDYQISASNWMYSSQGSLRVNTSIQANGVNFPTGAAIMDCISPSGYIESSGAMDFPFTLNVGTQVWMIHWNNAGGLTVGYQCRFLSITPVRVG